MPGLCRAASWPLAQAPAPQARRRRPRRWCCRRASASRPRPAPLTLEDAIRTDAGAEQRRVRSPGSKWTPRAQDIARGARHLRSAPHAVAVVSAGDDADACRRSAAAPTGSVDAAASSAGTLQLDGRTPWAGGRFTADFTSSRLETSNLLSRLNPQFPSSLGASYVQPLFRGRDASTRSAGRSCSRARRSI